MGWRELVLVLVLVLVQASGEAAAGRRELVLVQDVERVGGPRRGEAGKPRAQPVDENVPGVAAIRFLRRNQT